MRLPTRTRAAAVAAALLLLVTGCAASTSAATAKSRPVHDEPAAATVAMARSSSAPSPTPADNLARINDQVAQLQPTLLRAGIDVVSYSADYVTGHEVLYVYQLTPAKTATIHNLLGTHDLDLITTDNRLPVGCACLLILKRPIHVRLNVRSPAPSK